MTCAFLTAGLNSPCLRTEGSSLGPGVSLSPSPCGPRCHHHPVARGAGARFHSRMWRLRTPGGLPARAGSTLRDTQFRTLDCEGQRTQFPFLFEMTDSRFTFLLRVLPDKVILTFIHRICPNTPTVETPSCSLP